VVLQGERQMSKDNKTLGTFRLDGIPPSPRGSPQIEVTFDIDANGILHVGAKDLGTGKDQKITIQGSSGLSTEEVDKMTKEAELHAEEDKKAKESVETKNQLDSTIYQLEKTFKESGDKLPDDVKSKIEPAIEEAKKDLESGDVAKMKAAMENLSKVGQELYAKAAEAAQAAGVDPATAAAAAAAGAGAGAADGGEPKSKKEKKVDDVVDADFEVVDEDEKKS